MSSSEEAGGKMGKMIGLGTIAEVDLEAAHCTIEAGDIVTDRIPWPGSHFSQPYTCEGRPKGLDGERLHRSWSFNPDCCAAPNRLSETFEALDCAGASV